MKTKRVTKAKSTVGGVPSVATSTNRSRTRAPKRLSVNAVGLELAATRDFELAVMLFKVTGHGKKSAHDLIIDSLRKAGHRVVYKDHVALVYCKNG